MSHDPICWYADPEKIPAVAANDGWPCICDLLAKVREDQMRADYVAFRRANLDWYNRFMEDQKEDGYYDWFEMWLNQYTANLTSIVYSEIFTNKEA